MDVCPSMVPAEDVSTGDARYRTQINGAETSDSVGTVVTYVGHDV